MNKIAPPHVLRAMIEDDERFIFTTWIKVFHEVPPINFCISSVYLPRQREVIGTLLETANVLVACQPEEPDSILGYIVYEFVADILVVHWMHVKDPWRNQTLAKTILQSIYPEVGTYPIVCTHNFKSYTKMRHNYKLTYDPYFITTRMSDHASKHSLSS